jgi:ParB family chromosome partitioning protein
MKGEVVELDVSQISTKLEIRKEMGDMTTLEGSIRKLGLIQPIVVDRNNVLISGSRRLAACRNCGHSPIRSLRLDCDYSEMIAMDIQSDENLCRLPLSPEELEKNIQMKKNAMKDNKHLRPRGIISTVKKMLGGA